MIGEDYLSIVSGIFIGTFLFIFMFSIKQGAEACGKDENHEWFEHATWMACVGAIVDIIACIVIAFFMWCASYQFAGGHDVMVYLRSDIFKSMLWFSFIILFGYCIIIELIYHPLQKQVHAFILQMSKNNDEEVKMIEDYVHLLENELNSSDENTACIVQGELINTRHKLKKAREKKLKTDIMALRFRGGVEYHNEENTVEDS